jgi:3-oxoacyl-[acyl-carrier protein] reductase
VGLAIAGPLGLLSILLEDLPDRLGVGPLALDLREVGFPEALAHMDSVSTRGPVETQVVLGAMVSTSQFSLLWKEASEMELAGRVALVTGGSGDLGAAICRALAGSKMDVAVTFVGEKDRAQHVVAEVDAAGCRGWAVQLDQSTVDQPDKVIASVVEHFGRLDVLVNNAAWNIGIPFADLEALTPEIFDRMYFTNLRGPYLLARAGARAMKEQGDGRIVNVASIGGLYPASSSIAYSTTKAGLIHLTRCLAVALAPSVLVNCVAPGLIEGTRMAARLPDAVREGGLQRAVLHRAASVEDIAEQVITFCRTDSINGQVMPIDAGSVFN